MPLMPHKKPPNSTPQPSPLDRFKAKKPYRATRKAVSFEPDAADRAIGAIEAQALDIRNRLIRKARKDKKGAMQRNLTSLYSAGLNGKELTDRWITSSITDLCPWGTKTRARQLAWDYWGLGKKQLALTSSKDWEV